jgi:hypothetical protein
MGGGKNEMGETLRNIRVIPRESGDPFATFKIQWIPAFAGMTI